MPRKKLSKTTTTPSPTSETPDNIPESVRSSLEALQSSSYDSQLFSTLTESFPKMMKSSINILETALAGTGISTKERISLAKFLVQKGLDLQQLSQERQYAIIKTFMESQARLASEHQASEALVKSFKTGASSVLAGVFSGFSTIGNPTASPLPPKKLYTAEPEELQESEDPEEAKESRESAPDGSDLETDEDFLFEEPEEYEYIPESLRRSQE